MDDLFVFLSFLSIYCTFLALAGLIADALTRWKDRR